jgi:FtsZ-binding cell division protein ZapB
VRVLVAEKTQLMTQLQAKSQETYYFDTGLKHMAKQAVDTENALRQTAAEVEQLKKEKQQLEQLLQDSQQAAAMTNHQTKQEAAP